MSGTITYAELYKMIQNRSLKFSEKSLRFMTAISFDQQNEGSLDVELDTTGWVLTGTPEQMRDKLNSYLAEQKARVSDLYDSLANGKQAREQLNMSFATFHKAMQRIGSDAPKETHKKLFHLMDQDLSGLIGIEEVRKHDIPSPFKCTLSRSSIGTQRTFAVLLLDEGPTAKGQDAPVSPAHI